MSVLLCRFARSGRQVRSLEEPIMKSPLLRFLLLVFALCRAILLAQDAASITGTVTDPTGAAVANAQVVVTNAEHGINRTGPSNGDGSYLFAALPNGTYDMTIAAKGFKRYEAHGIV